MNVRGFGFCNRCGTRAKFTKGFCTCGGVLARKRCRICVKRGALGAANLCDGCWESAHRLKDFLKHPDARRITREILKKYSDN